MPLTRAAFRLFFGQRLATHAGDLQVEGITAPVTVRRDRYGVPHVDAACELDAWFALGFSQAQDRMGQLEFIVRVVRGALAEVVGREALDVDRLARRVGFMRAGAAQLALHRQEERDQIDAFVAGINQGLSRGAPRSSLEHALLRRPPTLWTAEDVQAYLVFYCFVLAANWDMELLRLKILELDGEQALRALDPTYPEGLPVTSPPGEAMHTAVDHLAHDLALLRKLTGPGAASNAWAVAPERCTSGRPMLANDLHLGPGVPNLSYLTRLRWPGGGVAGASVVGIPALAPGHNGHAAWGITAAHADNTDIFLEEIGPDGCAVRQGDGFVPCQVLQEEIKVKGEEPVLELVLVTPRGPIISPALIDPPLPGQANALSVSASFLQARPYTGLLGVHRSRSFEQCRELFRAASTSATTVTYADVTGKTGWFLAVNVPRRKAGFGDLPLPGWSEACGWEEEPVPFDQLPREEDPSTGYLCTANNQPARDSEATPFLGLDWLDGYRAARIGQALSARDDWDLQRTLKLQQDTTSLTWRELRPRVLALRPAHPDAQLALGLLRRWDGTVSSRSVGASLFELMLAEMCQRITSAVAPKSMAWARGKGFSPLLPYGLIITRRLGHVSRLLRQRPSGYFSSWEDQLEQSLTAAVSTLRDRGGPDSADWAWGQVRPLRLPHPFGGVKPLDRVFNLGPLPGVGDSGTIVQGTLDPTDPLGNQISLPMVRAVFDVGRWDTCRFVLAGGQSGNPFSPNYADQLKPWAGGEGIQIGWSEQAAAKRAKVTLRLIP